MIAGYLKHYSLWINLILAAVAGAATVQDFNGTAGQTSYILSQYEGGPGASIVNNSLRMVNTYGQRNVIAFDQTDSGLFGRIVAEYDLSLVAGADGLGFVLLNTDQFGTVGAGPAIGEEPSIAASFAVGFDIYCPDDYQKKGSHEISLHWDGVERANKWSSFDYRTGTFKRVRVEVDFVAGGAEITVMVAGNIIYDKYFLAGMTPYDSRVAFGARTGGHMTTLYIDNVYVTYENPAPSAESPISFRTFDRQLMNGHYRDVNQVFNFPSANTVYERVVMTLTVEQPDGGWDGWDRMMGIYIWDEAQQNRYEIARFMTPYSKAGTWYFDVTDYQTLLRGNRKMAMWLDSWIYNPETAGYWITTDFDFYEGNSKWRVLGVKNLWNGTPTYGAGGDPQMTAFFAEKQIAIPTGADRTKLRLMVTGHGQHPNTGSGAEFIMRDRTVTANAASYYNMLWKDDCYLNPCRPQSGTWQNSRAGWAPGDAVTPWEIDISSDVVRGETATIGYQADEYINTTPDWGNVSRHWVESQIIYYEKWSKDVVAYWQLNDNAGFVAADASGNGFDGMLKNMDSTSWTLGRQCGGLAFDGVDDYVEIPGFKGIAGGSSRTCTAWIKTSDSSWWKDIVGWGNNNTGQRWLVTLSPEGYVQIAVSDGYQRSKTPVNDGQWHHIAAVLENDGSPSTGEVQIYIDGIRETGYTTRETPINTVTGTNVQIGLYNYNDTDERYFNGLIDELRIYNRALNASEILDIYQEVPAGDFDDSGVIDMIDFSVLSSQWQDADNCDVDLTCDCKVNIDDLIMLIDQWLNSTLY